MTPGGFLAALSVPVPTGQTPLAFAAGDVDGDGKPDLVVLTQGPFNSQTGTSPIRIEVLLGNGDTTFRLASTFVVTGLPNVEQEMALRDVNADGKLDIVTAGAVFLGKGDGTFGPEIDFDAGPAPISLVVGDFNGDGKVDLLMGNYASQSGGGQGLRLLLGNGDGTFQAPVNFDPALSNVLDVVAGDFNGDGKLDLAETELGGITSLLFGNGDGTFQAPITLASNFNVNAAIDLNGDGKLDLAGIADGQVQVLLGNGDGTFRDPVHYAAGNVPIFAFSGDFNGDGKADLAVLDSGAKRRARPRIAA